MFKIVKDSYDCWVEWNDKVIQLKDIVSISFNFPDGTKEVYQVYCEKQFEELIGSGQNLIKQVDFLISVPFRGAIAHIDLYENDLLWQCVTDVGTK